MTTDSIGFIDLFQSNKRDQASKYMSGEPNKQKGGILMPPFCLTLEIIGYPAVSAMYTR